MNLEQIYSQRKQKFEIARVTVDMSDFVLGRKDNRPKIIMGEIVTSPSAIFGRKKFSVCLCNQQPKHNHKGDKQEETRQKLFIHVLGCPRGRCLGTLTAFT